MYKKRIERVQNIQLQNVVENVDNILENERTADKVIARTKSEILSLLSTLEERTTSVPLQTGDLADEPFDVGATERSPDSQPISRKRRAAWGQTGPVELAVQEGKQLCLAPSSSRTAQPPPTNSSSVNSTPTHPSPTQPGDECHLSETAECLEDVSCDLLSSESTFLPVSTPLRALHPHVPQTQSPTPPPLETNQKNEKPTRFSEDAHSVKFDNKLNPISASKKTGDLAARAQTKIFHKEDGRQVLGSKLAQKYSAKIPATSSRYESYEKRPIRPLNQGHVNSRIKSYPHRPGTVQMQTKGESKPGNKSKDKEIMTSNAVRSIALSRIKDVAESRKKLSQQTQSNKKLNVAIDNRTESRCRTALESRRTNVSPSPLLSKGENLIKGGAVQEAWVDNSVRDSGFLSRPCSDAIPIADGNNNNIETTAATRIQCLWRGYWARQRTPAVKWVREELRRRRMEEHILFLRAELDRHKLLYHDERQLRNLQLEAIKHMWKEIQSLQSWKNSILSDQASVTQQKHQNRDIENTMEKIEVIRGQRHQGEELSPPDSQAHTATQSELEYTCVHLQLQVRQLEEKLESLSAVVSSNQQLSDTLLSTQPDVKEGCVQVSPWSGDVSEASLCGTENSHARWSQMTSTDETDPPRELEPGCPAQPTLLQLHHRGDNSVVVLWQTPHRITGTLLGYRVYVNQEAVGMVAGHQTAALIEGLDPKQIYRFQVKAVSSLGESRTSHTVVAVFKSQLDIATIHQQSSSGNITDDDSDDGSVTGHKSGTNQPVQRTKKKSPRREKDFKHGGTCKANLNQEGASEESLASRKDSSSADELTIFRYPRLHTPKRSSRIKSPDATLSELSCANDTLSSEVDTLVTSRPPTSGYSPKLGETKAKTGALGVQNKAAKSPLSSDSSPKHQSEDQNDAPKRSRSRSGDSPATSSGIPPDPRVCWEEEVSHSRPPLSPNSHRPNKEDNIPLSPKRSNVSSADRVVNTNPVPTLSKRKPVGNTKAVDGADKELNKPLCDRRRTSVSDLLEQRLANKQNSSASDGGAFVKPAAPVSGCATFPSRSRTLEVIKSFSDDDVRKSKSENSSPTEKGQDVLAAGSESDSTVPFSIKSRTQGTFVSNLLQKLQTFSKAQEQIRDSKKSLKLRAKSSSDTALVGGEGDREEAWAGRIRRVSGGEDSEEEGRGVMSDSGPATPSSHQAKLNKGHRRSSSMHGAGPFVVREVAGIEGARSPIIMDGGKKKVSPSAGSGSGVRRHASFNGILPSRGQDIRPASEETLGGKIKSAPKPAPVESSGQPTFRSRSPSPNTSARSGVHQPVLSAAQLQRLKSPAGIGQ